MLWIFALTVLGGLVYHFRFRKPPWPGPGHMLMIFPRPDCIGYRYEYVKTAEPDTYPTDGASHLASYVERLIASTERSTSLMIYDLEGERGFSVDKTEGVIEADFSFNLREDGEREFRARQFFSSFGLSSSKDEVSLSMGSRDLAWPMQGDAEEITLRCQRILEEICDIRREEGLDITYEKFEPKTT